MIIDIVKSEVWFLNTEVYIQKSDSSYTSYIRVKNSRF